MEPADATAIYTHQQIEPLSVWTIDHMLNRPVTVLILGETGEELITEIRRTNMNTLVLSGTQPFSGTEYIR